MNRPTGKPVCGKRRFHADPLDPRGSFCPTSDWSSVNRSVRFRHFSHDSPDNCQEKATLIQQPQPVFMNLARHDCCATEAANPVTISDKKQSEVNMKTKLAVVCLSLILSAQAQLALAQSSYLFSNQASALVTHSLTRRYFAIKLLLARDLS